MKDLLNEKVKLEVKIHFVILLEKYYSGKVTWLQVQDEKQRIGASAKAILEEADVKPSYRSALEAKEFPLTEFLNQHRK